MSIKRIQKKKDFQDVFKKGTKSKGEIFSLYIQKDAETSSIATGITISKKFVPNAVKRNYIRRIVNAYFRENSGSLEKGMRVVARVTCNLKDVKKKPLSRAVRKDLATLLGNAGVLK